MSEPRISAGGNVALVSGQTTSDHVAIDELDLNTSLPIRVLYAALGFVFLGLGILGFIVPGLPGFLWLLFALWFFSRSNERMYRWMLTNQYFGQSLRDYKGGLGMPRWVKVVAVTAIVLAVSYSAGFVIEPLWLRIGLVALGAYGVYFVLSKPTREIELARRAAEAG